MKTIVILLFILLCQVASSQDTTTRQFFFNEFLININSTLLRNDNTNNKLGYGVGFAREIIMFSNLSVVFGLEYNQTNQVKNEYFKGKSLVLNNGKISLNSITIPINSRIRFGKGKNYYCEVGIYADNVVYAQNKGVLRSTNYITGEVTEEDISEELDIKRFNFGFNIGTGINIKFNDELGLIIKSQLTYGFVNHSEYITSIYNRYIKLGLGLKF